MAPTHKPRVIFEDTHLVVFDKPAGLLSQGEVLIFDEPTRGIDVGAKADIHQLIRDLAAQGKAVIVISSELPEVLALCHRILVMKEGRITGELHGPGITQAQLMHLATLPQALDPT